MAEGVGLSGSMVPHASVGRGSYRGRRTGGVDLIRRHLESAQAALKLAQWRRADTTEALTKVRVAQEMLAESKGIFLPPSGKHRVFFGPDYREDGEGDVEVVVMRMAADEPICVLNVNRGVFQAARDAAGTKTPQGLTDKGKILTISGIEAFQQVEPGQPLPASRFTILKQNAVGQWKAWACRETFWPAEIGEEAGSSYLQDDLIAVKGPEEEPPSDEFVRTRTAVVLFNVEWEPVGRMLVQTERLDDITAKIAGQGTSAVWGANSTLSAWRVTALLSYEDGVKEYDLAHPPQPRIKRWHLLTLAVLGLIGLNVLIWKMRPASGSYTK